MRDKFLWVRDRNVAFSGCGTPYLLQSPRGNVFITDASVKRKFMIFVLVPFPRSLSLSLVGRRVMWLLNVEFFSHPTPHSWGYNITLCCVKCVKCKIHGFSGLFVGGKINKKGSE